MNKIQKAFIWLGRICSGFGTILILISLVWRGKYIISGERYIGSIPYKMFWIGSAIFFIGIGIIMIIKRTAKTYGDR